MADPTNRIQRRSDDDSSRERRPKKSQALRQTPSRKPASRSPQPCDREHPLEGLRAATAHLTTMPSEREYQIAPIVQESVMHNTRVGPPLVVRL